jgi:hypothetical protein
LLFKGGEETEAREEWGEASKLYERARDIAQTVGARLNTLYAEGKMYETLYKASPEQQSSAHGG